MPRFTWKEDDMAHSLLFFPFVGAVIGALICLLNLLAPLESLPVAVKIIITMLIPVAVTGGFHVDGFMDTEDALSSCASREKKLEILKDPHVGAFAVIALVKWFLACAASVSAILLSTKCSMEVLVIYGASFVSSRCLSGLTSVLFEKARKNGMLCEETRDTRAGTVVCLAVQLLTAFILMICMSAAHGLAVVLTSLLYTLYYRHISYHEFGGVTGDTAGFFLTTLEILSGAVLAVTVYIF